MKFKEKKKILICSNHAWAIHNFRMPLVKFLRNHGFIVEILTEYDGYEEKFESQVDGIHSLFISRDGINPLIDFFTIVDIYRKLKQINPDYILLFSIKPVIYGSIAARILSIRSISMITGLGTGFLLDNWVTKIVKVLYRIALKDSAAVIFQNSDDKDLFIAENLLDSSIVKQTPGSGVNLERFQFRKLNTNSETNFILVARMIRDKGIEEYYRAAKILKREYEDINFRLLGPIGVSNRSSIKRYEIEKWHRSGIIEYISESDDIRNYIYDATCIVLPSYREGTSRVLLEAASMGRPLIATNVTGCKEIVTDGFNGYLCAPKDPEDLAKKMECMILASFEERQRMGDNSRIKIEKEFDEKIVFNIYLEILNSL